ncbi:putative BPI/LBP family protein At1g04970 [Rutidosis leptorrhynchoides]|uniref:putative BPI/LBP family protein At1g04970 n=1 Tax=Rutidosis leptorrhynchoides TaxID=125765 RepID=UPI003A99E8D3
MPPITVYLILIFTLFIPQNPTSADQSFISILINQNGLNFVKNLLITKAISSLIPTPLSQIEKVVRIPVIGKVRIVLSDIMLYRVNVGSSDVRPGISGISIAGSDVTSGMSVNWHYSYGSWVGPITISDNGTAAIEIPLLPPQCSASDWWVAKGNVGSAGSIFLFLGSPEGTLTLSNSEDSFGLIVFFGKMANNNGKFSRHVILHDVSGMEIGSLLSLDYEEGSMKLSVMECNCLIHYISVHLKGGASWLYQGIVDAFKDEIISAVEKAFIKKLKSEVSKLASVLQTLPKQIPVVNKVSLNVTFVNNPFLSDTSLGFEINGLFIDSKSNTVQYHNHLQPPVSCSDPSKMIGFALDEAVFESAFTFYYNAMFMHWIVDKVPEQNLLNTAGWRFIIPQLYKKYPNADMNLNISLSEPPLVQISSRNIAATVFADLIIDVLKTDETIPVICISLLMSGTGTVQIIGNNLSGHVKLDGFTMSLKWSKIGTLHMLLIQPMIRTMIKTVLLPYANAKLGIGFPLPIINGFMLQNAEIISTQSRITVCSDVSYEESFESRRIRIYTS